MKDGLEESFGGGSFTALQRAALLNLAWDHISSGLDGRESAFELHANGGIPLHRRTIRSRFKRYSQLANGVLEALSVDMPAWTWRSCARCGWPSRAWRFRCPPAPKSGVSGVDAELLPRVSTDGRDGGRHQL